VARPLGAGAKQQLFTADEIMEGYYTRHNVNALLRADATARAKFYNSALDKAKGWLARNEVRALEDRNPDDVQNETAPPPGMPSPFSEPDDEDELPPDDDDDEDAVA